MPPFAAALAPRSAARRLWRHGCPRYLRSRRQCRRLSPGCSLLAARHVMAAAPPRSPGPAAAAVTSRQETAAAAWGELPRAQPLARRARVYLSRAAPCAQGGLRVLAIAPPTPPGWPGTVPALFLRHKMEKRLISDYKSGAFSPPVGSLPARGLPQVEVGPALTPRSQSRGGSLGDTELLCLKPWGAAWQTVTRTWVCT